MQQSAIQNTSSAPAQGTQSVRGRSAAAGNGAADATAGFALLLAALGQGDPQSDGLLPAADASDTLPQSGSLLAVGDPAEILPETQELADVALPDPIVGDAAPQLAPAPEAPDAAVLAMLLALQGVQPGAAQVATQAGAESAAQLPGTPASTSAVAVASALPGAQPAAAAPAAVGMPGGPVDRTALALQGDSHWTPTSLVAETSRLDGAPDMAEPAQATGPRAAPGRGARPAGAPLAGSLRPADIAARMPVDARLHSLSGAAMASGGQPAAADLALAGELRRADGAAERSMAATGLSQQTAEAQAPIAAQSFASPDGGQPRSGGQARHGLPGAALDGGFAPAQPDAAPAGPQAVDAATLPGMDAGGQADAAQAQLAERVAWWVHQQTQSAALTVQDGDQAVQVQVALTGDQAHITFRSDEAQARQLLDAGTAELRSLLDAQGLQLAGVSVGPSSQGGGGASGRDPGDAPRPGARQGLARVPAAGTEGTASTAARRSTGVSERSVDIFV